MTTPRIRRAAAGITLLVLVAWPLLQSSPTHAAIKNPRVLIGSGLAGPYVNYPVAIEKKFFEKHGLKPELKIFSSGPEAIQAVGAGAVHLSHTGEFTHLTLKSRGADLAVVARNIVNTGDLGVGVTKGINGPKDLVGKTCAALLGGAGQWYAYRYRTVYGLGATDFKLINLAAPEWLPALARGDVQCFFGWEPWLTQLPDVVPGGKVIHRNGQDNVYVLQNAVAFNATWIKDDPDAARAAMLALIDTMAWVNDNRREAAQIAAKAFQADPAVLEKQMGCCTYEISLPKQLVDAFTDMARWGVEQGLIKGDAGQLVSGIFNPAVLKAAAPPRCTADLCRK
jgi:ABC-type nitrate/sulfonate/bicarbonate transport system substrate-binding protein